MFVFGILFFFFFPHSFAFSERCCFRFSCLLSACNCFLFSFFCGAFVFVSFSLLFVVTTNWLIVYCLIRQKGSRRTSATTNCSHLSFISCHHGVAPLNKFLTFCLWILKLHLQLSSGSNLSQLFRGLGMIQVIHINETADTIFFSTIPIRIRKPFYFMFFSSFLPMLKKPIIDNQTYILTFWIH